MTDHLNTSFPQSQNKYLKAVDFQDRELLLNFVGWKKKANEDDDPTKKGAKTWKQKLKYQLRYSYPQMAVDETGEPMVGRDGKPFQNRYYDPQFPKGYSIIYVFDRGELESGSLPLFEAFCRVAPKPNEKLLIKRTGKDKETVWLVTRANGSVHPQEVPEIDVNAPDDENVPF